MCIRDSYLGNIFEAVGIEAISETSNLVSLSLTGYLFICTLYRMTPAQRKQANALIRRECCCYEDGNCMFLDDGDTCTCPQTVSFSVCCKWFRWAVLPLDGTLEAEIFRDKDLKRCEVCGGVFVPKSNRAKYCPGCAASVHRRQTTESERKRRSAVDS